MTSRSILLPSIVILLLTACSLQAQGKEPLFTMFKPNYCITGIPMNEKPGPDNSDILYQISLRVNLAQDIRQSGWDMFFAYTQLSVWDWYMPSNPFRENTYMAGVYASNERWLTGYEHRSNGRGGNSSRTMDCAFLSYTQPLGKRFALQMTGRMGITSIGNQFGLELLSKYQGYGNVALGYFGDRLFTSLSFTPLFSSIAGNCKAEISFRPVRSVENLFFTLQYHYGYDEAQIDCGNPEGVLLRHMLRFGVSIQPSRHNHRLFF